ncbi:MAG: hypothetical protein JST94_02135 [Bacteroidetes bacterium]|nr:hypothetical protein [Bacteroidota bacterium]MBS1592165.1 hypothetical protein [Bacteroidota bacterium]MBS1639781.1 hypothetical protein [Bacteroidota bacterium]MBS1642566.1 hypothetical protein [Bacteroidota bacterium]MBS1670245.1 hypothetical protein [Bacteroidota bacterium]
MKFFTAILLTALLSFAFGLFSIIPWWSCALCSLLVALSVHQKPSKAFLSGFLALFLLWGIMALIIDFRNEHILATKIAGVLPLGGSAYVVILVTAIVGGLVAGLAALTGSYLRKK